MRLAPPLLPPPRRRRATENIVPMINVVFLLLIFFLISAQIAPPDPFEVTPPVSASDARAETGAVLLISTEGELALGDARGEEAVLAALAGLDPRQPLAIRADGRAPARILARLLPQLAQAGFARVSLVTGAAR